jgi:ABC-type multidrug transport system fused ATPase/permease subunit
MRKAPIKPDALSAYEKQELFRQFLGKRYRWAKSEKWAFAEKIAQCVGALVAILVACKSEWAPSERMNAIVSVLLPLAAGFSIFLFRWFASPYYLWREQKQKIADLEKRAAEDIAAIKAAHEECLETNEQTIQAFKVILSNYLEAAGILIKKCYTPSYPTPETANKWFGEVDALIGATLGRIYQARFSDDSGIGFVASGNYYGTGAQDVEEFLYKRSFRLNEFLREELKLMRP